MIPTPAQKPAFTVQVCSNVCPHVIKTIKDRLTEIRQIDTKNRRVDIHSHHLISLQDTTTKNRNPASDATILASQAQSASRTPLPTPSNSPSHFSSLRASETRTDSSSSNSRSRSHSVLSINQDEREEEVIFHLGKTLLKSDPNFIARKTTPKPDCQVQNRSIGAYDSI